jgi:hypothetical protein
MDRKTELLKGRLTDRINKKFRTKDDESNQFFIDQFHIDKGKVTVWCDNEAVDFISIDECNSFLNELVEIPGVRRPRPKPEPSSNLPKVRTSDSTPATKADKSEQLEYKFHIDGSVLAGAKEILLKSIEKLQAEDGEKYISQAQQINAEVKSIMELAKTEIEMAKTKVDIVRTLRQ